MEGKWMHVKVGTQPSFYCTAENKPSLISQKKKKKKKKKTLTSASVVVLVITKSSSRLVMSGSLSMQGWG